jgi:YfiH family protein
MAGTDGVRFHGEPAGFLSYSGLSELGLSNAVTTRHCHGIPAVSDQRWPVGDEAVRMLRGGGIEVRRAAFARQVHGVAVALASTPGSLGTADIIVTRTADQPVAIFTADCLAVVLFDPERRVLGVAHVGWRGTVAGGARVAVEALAAMDASPRCLRVAIAPSIGPCCYEVDAAVVEPLAVAFPASHADWLEPAAPGKWMLDLWASNEAQLVAAGVLPEHIENPRLCTACRRDLFYSYRKRDYGRLVTLAALPGRSGGRPAPA